MRLIIFLLSSCYLAGVDSLLPIAAKGSKFFDSGGKQFFIKGTSISLAYAITSDAVLGIVYYPYNRDVDDGYNATSFDVLANPEQCVLDAPLMQSLGVNTISVLWVDSTFNHTECMKIFNSHGIYVSVTLSTAQDFLVSVSHLIEGNGDDYFRGAFPRDSINVQASLYWNV